MPRVDNTLTLTNAQARAVFLQRHHLTQPPSGPGKAADMGQVLDALGFVQVDSINTLARAHDLILWSRRQQYRPTALRHMVDRDRTAFEGWTHDASILPISALPHWHHKFRLDREVLLKRWKQWHRGDFLVQTDQVLNQIAKSGPVGSADVGVSEKRGTGGWWDWHPSKTALEFLWRTGKIAVTRRDGFRKIYDLAENIYPNVAPSDWNDTIDWACSGALHRLGFATAGEIAAFWNLVPVSDVKKWVTHKLAQGELTPVQITNWDGTTRDHVMLSDDISATRRMDAPSQRPLHNDGIP